MGTALRYFFLLIVLATLVLEGYYISTLRNKISQQSEALKNISMQMQSLKNERDSLHEELSLIKKPAGENKDEYTSDRHH